MKLWITSKLWITLWVIPVSLVLTVSVQSADWPRFLGSNQSSVSPETGINKDWKEHPPKELWAVKTGPGFGGAAIADGKVYFLDRENDQQDVLRCLDLETGKELWKYGYDAPGRPSYNGSRTTPTVDGQYVYTVGVFGHVHCFDTQTHQPVWSKDFSGDFGSRAPNWAFAQSPLRYKDVLIVAPMSSSAGIAGLDAKTGEVKWKSVSIGGDTYMSPSLVKVHGSDQLLLLTILDGKTALSAVDPNDGNLLWQFLDSQYYCKIPIPAPTYLGDGKLHISGGYGAGSINIQVEKDGDKWSARTTKYLPDYGSQIQPVIFYEGYLYANLNTNENLRGRNQPDGLVCMNREGEIVWQTHDTLPINRGGLLIVDDTVLVMGGETGVLHQVEATHEGFHLLNSHPVFTELRSRDNQIWGPPAFSEGKLVVRNQEEMKCIDLSK